MQRFMAKVVKAESGCWIWTGFVGTSGYGEVMVNAKKEKAHRIAYQLFVGRITEIDGADYRGTCVIHKCDNRVCVNPEHLLLGTHQDNMTDKVSKGRVVCRPLLGDKHQNSKLTSDDIVDIRCLNAYGSTVRQIAESFGVARATIHRVLDGTTWNHI
jgi:predicted DNA-binding protein (UPF0251 family)